MSTSEDLLNKIFVNPLDSIGRKLHRSRRRHTADTIQQLSGHKSAMSVTCEENIPRSRHESMDYGEPIPVELADFQEVITKILLFLIYFSATCGSITCSIIYEFVSFGLSLPHQVYVFGQCSDKTWPKAV